MQTPSGPASLDDVLLYGRLAWYSLTARPDHGGAFPVAQGDIDEFALQAVEELAESGSFMSVVRLSSPTVSGVSQYTTPSGLISVRFAVIGGERVVPPVGLDRINAAINSDGEELGAPRACHFDRDLSRLILYPAPASSGDTIDLVASLSFNDGARIPVPLLGYVTLRAIERARLHRDASMPDVSSLVGGLAEYYLRMLP